MTTILLERDISDFLCSSPYLNELLANEAFPEAGIEIPKGCGKADLSVTSCADLTELLVTLRFWLVPEVAEQATDLIAFVLEKGRIAALVEMNLIYARDIPFVKILYHVSIADPHDQLTLAAGLGASTIVEYLFKEAEYSHEKFPHGNCTGYMRSKYHHYNEKVAGNISLTRYTTTIENLLADTDGHHADAVVLCAHRGSVDFLEILLERSASFDSNPRAPGDALFIAAKKGHIDCLCCLWSAGIWRDDKSRDDNLLSGATAGGHVESFRFAIEMGIQISQFTDWTIDTLLRCDNIECLSYLHRAGLELTRKMFVVAVEYRSNKCFRYLLDQNCPFIGTYVCNTAAGDNNLELLRYAHEKGLPIGVETCFSAARAGSLSCLKYLRQHTCSWNAEACRSAASAGSLECLQYLHENGCPWDVHTCANAASGNKNRLNCLRYAHQNGCPWNEATCTGAVVARDIHCLIYAHENGCPWDFHTGMETTSKECFKYLLLHDCPGVKYNRLHLKP